MTVTVLSGTSGALYYKPAGTSANFGTADVTPADDEIQLLPFLGFRPGDPVQFSVVNLNTGAAGTGTLPAGLTASTDFFVVSYVAATGVLKVSATAGGAAVDITDAGTAVAPNAFKVEYAKFEAIGEVREWSFEITRDEIDVTTIGQDTGEFVPFRSYISGFADGTGNAMVYTTDEDTNIASRLVADVLRRQQVGATMKLYLERVVSGGTVNDTLSRSITVPVILSSASFNVNPDDGQMVDIAFRPSAAPDFDLSKS